MSGEPPRINYIQSHLVPLNEFRNLVTDHLAILIEVEQEFPEHRVTIANITHQFENTYPSWSPQSKRTPRCNRRSFTIFASLSPQLKHTPSSLRALCPRAHLSSSPYSPVHLQTSGVEGFRTTPYAKDAPLAFSKLGLSVSTQLMVFPTNFEGSNPYMKHNSIFARHHKHHGASAKQVHHSSMVRCSNL